ncbi:hypothetical protein [Microbacterium sp. NPDC064584]|uniref:hypothetical protein n=1 Tax=Microbacterium sp. NPDC064584 TaxID=3155817 RepID=UPI0034185C08
MSDAQSGASAVDSVGGAVHDSDDKRAQVDGNGQPVQNEPVLEQNDASTEDKLQGIAAQTRVDLGDESHDRYAEVIRQRLSDAQIELSDDEVTTWARRAHPSGGDGV